MDADAGAPLAGRKILITGAASGIGRATAQRFAASGAKLALLDINSQALPAVAAELGATFAVVDLRDVAATQAAVRDVAEQLSGLDGVVNVAGIAGGSSIEDLDPAFWNNVLAVNLTAPYLVCRTALPWLKRASAATIVNVSSGSALLPNFPGFSAYVASKAGLIGFTKVLAVEAGPTVRANVLCPGLTRTPMTAGADYELAGQQYALKRAAAADEMAKAALFLTSDASSFVTGSVLTADGGRTFH